MSKVRAKFICVKVEDNNGGKNVEFQAVVDGSDENKSFSEYTPSAQLLMFVSDTTPAAKAFEDGKEYYLDFTPAE